MFCTLYTNCQRNVTASLKLNVTYQFFKQSMIPLVHYCINNEFMNENLLRRYQIEQRICYCYSNFNIKLHSSETILKLTACSWSVMERLCPRIENQFHNQSFKVSLDVEVCSRRRAVNGGEVGCWICWWRFYYQGGSKCITIIAHCQMLLWKGI